MALLPCLEGMTQQCLYERIRMCAKTFKNNECFSLGLDRHNNIHHLSVLYSVVVLKLGLFYIILFKCPYITG